MRDVCKRAMGLGRGIGAVYCRELTFGGSMKGMSRFILLLLAPLTAFGCGSSGSATDGGVGGGHAGPASSADATSTSTSSSSSSSSGSACAGKTMMPGDYDETVPSGKDLRAYRLHVP